MIRVYQFGLRPPIENAALVRDQLRAAHEYRVDLARIEAGRRGAIRALEDTAEVREAIALARAATRSTRRDALRALSAARKFARKSARCEGGRWAVDESEVDLYPYSPLFELERIGLLEHGLRLDARAMTRCYWGTYLSVEAAHDQVRKAPLYDEDGLTPHDPRVPPWRGAGAIGVQLQGGGLPTPRAQDGQDTRVSLHDGILSIRVGSDGRAPIWARLPAVPDRAIPDAALWKWVRVSLRREGPRERWTCEVTVDDPAPHPRTLDRSLGGVLAVEVAWDQPDDELAVAYWRDDAGQSGTIHLSPRDVEGLRKPASIEAVRSALVGDLRPRLARELAESQEPLPAWLAAARDELRAWTSDSQLWRTPGALRGLYYRWLRERCDAARSAFTALDEWEKRDRHLWEYSSGMRGQVLRRRRERYRVQAVAWSRRYRHVILDDRNLSREARWGEASDLRFLAAPSELRGAITLAFGPEDMSTYPYRAADEDDERSWCERALEAWIAGGARAGKNRKDSAHGAGGAWRARRAKKFGASTEIGAARNERDNPAKSEAP